MFGGGIRSCTRVVLLCLVVCTVAAQTQFCQEQRDKCQQKCGIGSSIDFKCDSKSSGSSVSCSCSGFTTSSEKGDTAAQDNPAAAMDDTSNSTDYCARKRGQCSSSCPEGTEAIFDCDEKKSSTGNALASACSCLPVSPSPEGQGLANASASISPTSEQSASGNETEAEKESESVSQVDTSSSPDPMLLPPIESKLAGENEADILTDGGLSLSCSGIGLPAMLALCAFYVQYIMF